MGMQRAGRSGIDRWTAGTASGRVSRAFLTVVLTLAAPIGSLCRADVGPPAHLRISEREPGLFVTQWRVPRVLPPRAVPVPALPEACVPLGEYSVEEQATAWLFAREWRCDAGLAGEPVGMRYPFADLALTTVIRVDLLSGDRFAHLLAPGEKEWRLPEGTVAPDPLLAASRAVLAGVSHTFGSWAHLPFVVALALLGGARRVVRVVSAFTLGQLPGAMLVPATGLGIVPAEIGIAIVAALLAREALRRDEDRHRLAGLGASGGLVHGAALGSILAARFGDDGAGLVARLLAVLGSDAVHLTAAAAVAMLCSLALRAPGPARLKKLFAYASGATGMALALALTAPGGTAAQADASFVPAAPAGGGGEAAAAQNGSRRVAPVAGDAALQSFLVVEPYEVRHETMLRLAGLAETVGLEIGATIEVADQPGLAERLARWVVDGVTVRMDGTVIQGVVRRADFMTVDATGALPRATPAQEHLHEALVGVVVAYPVQGMPGEVSLRWEPFPAAVRGIPATVIDPESVVTTTLSAAAPSLSWRNSLAEDPIPAVEAVAVEPVTLPVPLLSLPLVAAALVVLIVALRRRRIEGSLAVVRVILAVAIVAGPAARTTVALPGSSGLVPTERQARRILAGLLPNVYRAMEYRAEEAIYDRLAVSVMGDKLTEVYLEQRRTLEMEERGGAQARVETVEVLDAREIARREEGFTVRSEWTVGGMVTHFGHRHFRQNRYAARLTIAPQDRAWKIRDLEMLELERLK